MRKKIFLLAISLLWQSILLANNSNPSDVDVVPGVVVARAKTNALSQQNPNLNKLNLSGINKIEPAFSDQLPNSPLFSVFRIYFSKKFSPRDMAVKLSATGLFEYVEPVYVSRILGFVPNDTLFARQFYLQQTQTDLAWTISSGSPDVVIAIVDNGTDYTHPDLAEHLWTNFAEANGVAGVDDDGNGYVDDVHGWDFGNDDADPVNSTETSRIAAHGTHTAGLAAAVTNNVTGIAGAGFSCHFMPVKVSADDDPLQIPFGYDGIIYAADNGADIINCSWGHAGSFSQFEQDVINYAVSKGCLIVAAGGNSNTDKLFYPASYVHVFAVAAVDENDRKASYSSFGDFIDIAAPGGDEPIGKPGLLSLYPVSQGSYGEMSGTSMASPLTAGIMGLLRAQYPDWNMLRLYRQLALTADRIDDKNPDYAGKLGVGRVNSFRALTEANLPESPAEIHFFSAGVSDTVAGNANFLFERNEIIHVSAAYQNFALSAGRNFQLRLLSLDPDLETLDATVQIANFPPDSIVKLENALSFRISENAQTHLAPLVLNFELENGAGGADTIFVPVGKSAVLLVDDDGGKNIDEFYTFWLKKLKVDFLRWDREFLGSPPSIFMRHFPMTIWFCEWAFPSLDADDRAALTDYLDRGGDLFISGQDIGWDLADPNGEHSQFSEEAQAFYENYLHSVYKNDNSLSEKVEGMPGTFGQDLNFKIYQPGIPFHFQFPDWIEPASGAVSCFRYENQRGAGVYFQGQHRVLNLGFGFEAIDSQQNEDPERISRPRQEFMQRIFQFLGPLRHQPVADAENDSSVAVTFRAELAPLVDVTDSLYLSYRPQFFQQFSRVAIHVSDAGTGAIVIHFENYNGEIEYFFQLKDPYFTFSLPVDAPSHTFSFRLGADEEKPKLAHVPPPDIIAQNKPRKITVAVTDNLAVDASSVELHFSVGGVSDSLSMVAAGENLFVAEIPPLGVIGDSVVYFFTASDAAKNPNRARSENFSYFIGRESFEFGFDSWQSDSTCWRLDDREYHSAMFSVSTFPGGAYPKNTDASLYLIPGIPVRALKEVNLTFWTKYEMESGHDFGAVELKTNSAGAWQLVGERIGGETDHWREIQIPLDSFYFENDDSVFLRFHFQSDSVQEKPMAGWFIDDIEFQKKSGTEISAKEKQIALVPELFTLSANFPNPFNSVTRIRYWLREPSEVRFVILNLKGQRVWESRLSAQQSGFHDLVWDGTNFLGGRCTTGVYFLRMTAGKKQLTKTMKMILLQ
ncbi:MAG: S8 family serine peptidase [Calditrichaeota bacterium]|nr:S8 family serine peptidase [Calditrichota bacterium]